MANTNKKTIYLILGFGLLLFAIPVIFLVVAMIAGFVFYAAGAQ